MRIPFTTTIAEVTRTILKDPMKLGCRSAGELIDKAVSLYANFCDKTDTVRVLHENPLRQGLTEIIESQANRTIDDFSELFETENAEGASDGE